LGGRRSRKEEKSTREVTNQNTKKSSYCCAWARRVQFSGRGLQEKVEGNQEESRDLPRANGRVEEISKKEEFEKAIWRDIGAKKKKGT